MYCCSPDVIATHRVEHMFEVWVKIERCPESSERRSLALRSSGATTTGATCCPVLTLNDLCGALRNVDRRQFVVTAVEDLLIQVLVGLLMATGCLLRLDHVELRDLVVRRRRVGNLSSPQGEVGVARGEGMGGDDMADVNDGTGHDVVPAVAVQQPVPVALAEV